MAKFAISYFFLIVVYITILIVEHSCDDLDVQVITIATEATDGFRRYAKSLQKYDLNLKVTYGSGPTLTSNRQVFGMGEQWDGGDVARYAGGGQKVNLLKEGLKEYADRDDLLLLFTDSYDVIFTSGAADIIEKFKKLDARVVFSAEDFCWPDKSLANSYPQVKSFEYRFLNSGGFIGYAKDIYAIVQHKDIGNRDDDQLYYTKIFLDKNLRKKWNIKLDTKAELFQNLNGALGDVSLKSIGSHSYLYNDKTGTTPVVVHGNGPIKVEFNRLANYLADGWTTHSGCLSCNEDTISLENVTVADFPTVLMAVFIERAMPFLPEFFQRLDNLTYPKEKIDLYIHNAVDKYHDEDLKTFLDPTKDKYRSVTLIGAGDKMTETAARNWAIEMATMKASQYYFNVDGNAHVREPNILQMLIEQNRTVLAPVVKRPYQLWSNFWGAIGENGFYARSVDYMDIIEDKKKGLWNVPYISSCYLVHGSLLPSLKDAYTDKEIDPDMKFCQTLREMGIFMYVSNLHFFGHLVNYDNYDTKLTHSDFYQMMDNPWDWEQRYIHVNYTQNFDLSKPLNQPCPDVFWFPVVTETYADHLVDIMESFGQWSGGGNKDPRLASGYENVPTIDIHMNQVGLEPQWLEFLRRYISPLQQRAFEGYFHDPPTALMNFVVRYKPTEQPSLRPHHDSSTFTINIALNRPGIDYQGGGCRFIRYNCSATALRKGWMLMHPGRLTHYHEGLPTTGGTRYIMISFVDP